MPVIYYTYYTPVSDSVRTVEAQEHLLGRTLLLTGLKELYHILYSIDELEESLLISPEGKPYLAGLPGIHFNITHCHRLVACAFSCHPIGIDGELPGTFENTLIKKVFSPEEKHFFYQAAATAELRIQWFFKFWTLKEAYVKKTGTGISIPLTELTFTFSHIPTPDTISCPDPGTACRQFVLKTGHILSVCYESADGDETISLNLL